MTDDEVDELERDVAGLRSAGHTLGAVEATFDVLDRAGHTGGRSLVALQWAFTALRAEAGKTPFQVSGTKGPGLSATLEVAPADDWRNAGELVASVLERVRRFLAGRGLLDGNRIRTGELVDEAGVLRAKPDGSLVLDALLAELLEELGATKNAASVRATKPGERGQRWVVAEGATEPTACQALFRAVWKRILAERKEAEERKARELERARSSRPAVVRATLADVLLPVMSRQGTLPMLDDGRVRDAKGRELGRIALVSARMTHEGVRRGLELFGTVTGNRLLKSLVLRSHEQQERGDPFALRVRYLRGYAGLAEALGYRAKDTSELVRLAHAGAAVVWATPYARGLSLWALAETRGNERRPGEVAFTLNTPLAPGYAAELADAKHNSLPARTARRLVPELRYEPPTGAVRPNEAGAVWTLHRRFLLELVDRAEELVTHGGVSLSVDDWRRFAGEVGLPLATLPRVLDAWRAGESDTAPALLAEPEPGCFTLADVHDLERRFLLEAGARRLKGREAGRKGKGAKSAD